MGYWVGLSFRIFFSVPAYQHGWFGRASRRNVGNDCATTQREFAVLSNETSYNFLPLALRILRPQILALSD
jgi:hypothetical protein